MMRRPGAAGGARAAREPHGEGVLGGTHPRSHADLRGVDGGYAQPLPRRLGDLGNQVGHVHLDVQLDQVAYGMELHEAVGSAQHISSGFAAIWTPRKGGCES